MPTLLVFYLLISLVFVTLVSNITIMKYPAPNFQQELTTPIIPPVQFLCTVSGEAITASFIGRIDHPLYHCFRIQFSNGYEDDFTLLENGFVLGDKEKSSAAYAFAIKDDLNVLVWFSADKEIYTMRWKIKNIECNVWVMETLRNEDIVYTVHYNSDYRFQLKKEGTAWLAGTARQIDPEIINDKLAAEIGRMIDRQRGAV